MNKILRYGMVGGGPGSFIGDAHRRAIALDSTAQLVAGVFSSHPEKSRQTARELGVDITYAENGGGHEWPEWNDQMAAFIDWRNDLAEKK